MEVRKISPLEKARLELRHYIDTGLEANERMKLLVGILTPVYERVSKSRSYTKKEKELLATILDVYKGLQKIPADIEYITSNYFKEVYTDDEPDKESLGTILRNINEFYKPSEISKMSSTVSRMFALQKWFSLNCVEISALIDKIGKNEKLNDTDKNKLTNFYMSPVQRPVNIKEQFGNLKKCMPGNVHAIALHMKMESLCDKTNLYAMLATGLTEEEFALYTSPNHLVNMINCIDLLCPLDDEQAKEKTKTRRGEVEIPLVASEGFDYTAAHLRHIVDATHAILKMLSGNEGLNLTTLANIKLEFNRLERFIPLYFSALNADVYNNRDKVECIGLAKISADIKVQFMGTLMRRFQLESNSNISTISKNVITQLREMIQSQEIEKENERPTEEKIAKKIYYRSIINLFKEMLENRQQMIVAESWASNFLPNSIFTHNTDKTRAKKYSYLLSNADDDPLQSLLILCALTRSSAAKNLNESAAAVFCELLGEKVMIDHLMNSVKLLVVAIAPEGDHRVEIDAIIKNIILHAESNKPLRLSKMTHDLGRHYPQPEPQSAKLN